MVPFYHQFYKNAPNIFMLNRVKPTYLLLLLWKLPSWTLAKWKESHKQIKQIQHHSFYSTSTKKQIVNNIVPCIQFQTKLTLKVFINYYAQFNYFIVVFSCTKPKFKQHIIKCINICKSNLYTGLRILKYVHNFQLGKPIISLNLCN